MGGTVPTAPSTRPGVADRAAESRVLEPSLWTQGGAVGIVFPARGVGLVQRTCGRAWRKAAAAGFVATGFGIVGFTVSAWAAGTITASPNTGLTNGQTVNLSGSGFAASSTGNLLECNNAPGQPTVHLGSPVNSDVSVGCTAPALSASTLTSTSATGTVSKAYQVKSGTIGPPCGVPNALISTCPATDSAGKSPTADAANYPCPPTAAQQSAGVTCSVSFGDQAGDQAQATISFQGQSSPTTTAAPTATTQPVSTTTAPTPVVSPSLAFTGPGPQLWWLAVVGAAMLAFGTLLWITVPRRSARRATQ